MGDLYISGAGLARGYLNNPELTAEKFIAHPFKQDERLYKTGDLARWLPDGNIEFSGRIDHQLKIRGYRIESGEIEQILLSHEAIQSAVVIGYNFENGKELVAYLVPKTDETLPNITELRTFLGETLPDYMIPTHFVELKILPLTSSGKVNRKALPKPDNSAIGTGMEYVAPRNIIEEQLVEIWQSVLNKNEIGVYDNFFVLGGHSLRAIRLVSLIQQQLSVEIKLSEIFARPTIASLAQKIAEQKHLHPIVLQSIPSIAKQENYALSNAQRRLWILDKMDDNLTAYNMPAALRLHGDLDIKILEKTFQILFDRHEILRTRFISVEGEGRQVIDEVFDFKLKVEIVENQLVETLATVHANHVFDLEKEHLLKVQLLKIKEQNDENILLFNMHHIISDGWSMGILIKELSTIYEALNSGQNLDLKLLTIQYKDYAAWQNTLLEDENTVGELRDYWQNQLVDLPTLDLPLDYSRPAVKTYNGSSVSYQFSKEITRNLNDYTQQQGATLFMTLMALVNTILYRYTNQTDIVIGTPTAGRNHPDLHDQIGFYINTLAIRNEIDANLNFETLLKQVKQNSLQAFENELYPFDKLVEELDIPRDMSRSAIFDVMVVLQNNEEANLSFGNVNIDMQAVETNISKFDLTFNFSENEGVLVGNINYNTDLFRHDRIERMFGHLECLIQSIFENDKTTISNLNILPKSEQKLLLETFNNTTANYPKNKAIADLFEAQAEKTPNNIAIIFENKQLTYKELNEKSNQLANYLREKYDTKGDDIIALQLERSEWMIIAILGVLKSGAAYLPIGTDLPKSRVKFMLKDSHAKVLLTDMATFETPQSIDNQIDIINIEMINYSDLSILNCEFSGFNSSNLAYIIYTSGSTGNPKGVMVEQQGLVNMAWSQIGKFKVTETDNILQFATYTFDASVSEILMTLFSGATLVLYQSNLTVSSELLALLQFNKISFLTLPPTLLSTLDKNELLEIAHFRGLITAGDAPIIEDVQTLKGKLSYFNAYGPTEYCVCISTFEVPKNWSKSFIPIGSPIANTEVYILDKNNNCQAVGIAGELCVSGAGLARGYLNNPELTAEKFIAHPFKQGERLYKTGDLARWLPDGNMEFLGRIDHQLKIRGYRIEAGEIEQILLSHEAIQSAVIIGYNFENRKELVAYLVPKTHETLPNVTELRTFLGESLPDYMIPTHFVELEILPLTSSGKINRKALPKPDNSTIGTGMEYVAPRNVIEEQLVEIWQAVLNKNEIGIYDNFFVLGGHSLRAIRLMSLIQQELFVEIKLSEIFARPTIASLAQKIAEQKHLHPIVLQSIPSIKKQENYALSNAQRRLWVLDKMDDNLTAYNMPAVLRLRGDLNIEILEKTFQILFNRYEILRTRFISVEGEGRQVIDEVFDFKLKVEILENQLVETLAKAHANHVFDLEKEHLLKVQLLKIKEQKDENILLFNMHHIISDGWSMGILIKELSTIYEALNSGQSIDFKPFTIQYKDYSAWQNALLEDENTVGELRDYWQNQLADLPTLDLSLDYSRPTVKTYNGSSVSYQFSKEITKQLNDYTQQQGATLFMTLTALVNTILYRYTNQTDVVIGTPTAGRNHPDLHNQIGFYINTLAIRNEIDTSAGFTMLLKQVKQNSLQAFENELYPFDKLVEELDISRDMSRSAIFDVMVVLQNNEEANLSFGDINIDIQAVKTNISKFDLTFNFSENEGVLSGNINYNTDLFRHDRIERMFGHLECLIQSIFENDQTAISNLNILPKSEQKLLLETFNNTAADYQKNKTITDLFEAQAKKTPDNIAIVFESKQLTYKQLNEKANQLANYLREKYDTKGNDIIALQLERSEWMIIAILGVLKSGAAYLPIGTDLPKSRVEFMLKDSHAKALLTDTVTFKISQLLNNQIIVKDIETITYSDLSIVNCEFLNFNSSNLAYIIYTSGSTGVPKGVMVEHTACFNLVYGLNSFTFSKLNNKILQIAQVAAYSFDASIQTIFGSLCFGHRLHIVTDELKRSGSLLSQFIKNNQIDVIDITPTLLNVLLKGDFLEQNNSALQQILIGGEALSVKLLKDFYKNVNHQSVDIYNVYGPTEATVNATYYKILPQKLDVLAIVPIGKPLPNYEVYITDYQGNLQPVGTAGELLIGGAGLARGYLNNPELTAEKFIPHPFKQGERLYKTGDLARWLPDGNIEFSGRIDHQLKIRGYRIESGEIEQILLSHEAIQSAVVIGYNFENGKELVAYIVPKTSKAVPNVTELRTFLGESLPDYMIPTHFVELEILPLTSSGKVNRKALPKPDNSTIGTGMEYVAPRNIIEEQLVEIWQSVLNKEEIGIYDNFFVLGGHSLRAIRLVSLIQQELSVEIKLSEIFARPTIASLAQKIAEQKHLHPIVLQSIPRIEKQENYALSNAQRRLWVLDKMDDNLTAYNMPAVLRLHGDLNIEILEKTFQILFNRHEILRTRFISVEGEGRQVIDEVFDFKLKVEIVENQLVETLAKAHANHIFDLEKEHLLKVQLLKIKEQKDENILLFNMHHIISDGWSMGILIQELSTIYEILNNGQNIDLKPLTIQYKDYAAWQNALLEDENTVGELRNYWQNQLADLPSLDLPLDFPRPAVKTYKGSSVSYQFSKEITQNLNDYTQQQGATLFMTLTALVNTILYRYTNQTDIVIGTPTAGRNHPDLHNQIGFYINTLAIRNEIDANLNFETLLKQVKQNSLQAFENELYPFDKLVEELDIPRDMSRSAIFDVMVVLQNNEKSNLSFGEVNIDVQSVETNISKFDLTFNFSENEGVLSGNIEYNTDLFRHDRIERIFGHLECLIQSIFENGETTISNLNILPKSEQKLLLETFNDTTADYPKDKTIADLFEAQAEKTPDNIAIIFKNKQLTYKQLNEKANQLANYLHQKYDTKGDDIIALKLERSEWMIIAILGVLKSGAAYLPIGTDLPKSRVEFMLKDSHAKVLLSDTATFETSQSTDNQLDIVNIETINYSDLSIVNCQFSGFNSSNLAYIIYTSGSTGMPKGVMIEQHAIINTIISQNKNLSITTADNILNFANYTFDASVWEILTALMNGATLVLTQKQNIDNPNTFLNTLKYFEVSVTLLPPPFLSIMNKIDLSPLKILVSGGDTAKSEDLIHYANHLRCFNAFGPTESSVYVSLFEITKEWSNTFIPIGSPIANTEVYILDKNNNCQAIGIAGELCVSGSGLARGYLNNPELTAEKFITHPFKQDERLYKTGDLARWLPDGNIEFLGRIDHQLKIRGYRIEAGEIEQILLSHEAIQSAVVIAYDFENGKELVAYLVPKMDETLPNITELRTFLGETLPDYMIPTHFVELEILPLTSSGKVNRKALPKPDNSTIGIGMEYVAPRNIIEEKLVEIWQTVLNKEEIGIYDNFFALGGHSLRAIQLSNRINQTFDLKFTLATIFKSPTLVEMAKALQILSPLAFAPSGILLTDGSAQITLFAFPPALGLAVFFKEWVYLLEEFDVYAFDFLTEKEISTEEERRHKYYQEIKLHQAEGPYYFMGYSAGGNLAYEMVKYMEAKGEIVYDLVLLDSGVRLGGNQQTETEMAEAAQSLMDYIETSPHLQALQELLADEWSREKVMERMLSFYNYSNKHITTNNINANIHLLQSGDEQAANIEDTRLYWPQFTEGEFITYQGQGEHIAMFQPPHLVFNAMLLKEVLEKIVLKEENAREEVYPPLFSDFLSPETESATIYALGLVLTEHFEREKTLIDFFPETYRFIFPQEVELIEIFFEKYEKELENISRQLSFQQLWNESEELKQKVGELQKEVELLQTF